MLVILKRGGILFLVLLCVVSFLIAKLFHPKVKDVQAENVPCIVIDAGHGAPDGGAEGRESGVLEKDLNLQIAKLLSEELTSAGERVLMTREDDRGLYETESASIREKKREDMKKRAALAGAEGNLCLVSIHMNHFSDARYSGPQVFYYTGSEEGQRLAESIRAAFLEEIGPHCTREVKPTSDLYLLRESEIPAVIVECGFLSNTEEEALLCDAAYQGKLARAICLGIQNFKEKA